MKLATVVRFIKDFSIYHSDDSVTSEKRTGQKMILPQADRAAQKLSRRKVS